MTRKAQKEKDNSMSKAVKSYQQWNKMIKDLENRGFHGTDYYINRVKELETEVKELKEKLKNA
jgi:polyhydroxyalkanoate synthesis regulator phasin